MQTTEERDEYFEWRRWSVYVYPDAVDDFLEAIEDFNKGKEGKDYGFGELPNFYGCRFPFHVEPTHTWYQ